MTEAVYMEKREPEANQFRFYEIAVAPTLFGQWAVVREWGRIGSSGTMQNTWHESEGAAQAAARELRRVKERRGYRLLQEAA